MSNSIKDRITDELQKAKTEGSTRVARIGKIAQDAASQAVTEVKEGSGEIRAIAKNALSTVVENLNETREEVGESSTEEIPPTSFKTLMVKLFRAIRDRFLTRIHQQSTDWKTYYTEFQRQTAAVNEKLVERYGDRYKAAQQRLDNVATWYNTTKAQAETQGSTVLQQKQTELEDKASQLGAVVAQKEQKVRQQLKTLLQTAASKL